MIIGVFGPGHLHGEEYKDYSFVADQLDDYPQATKIVTGGGIGVERLALRYARENSLEPEVVPPNIRTHKDKAFVIRNQEILELVTLAVLLWDGNDKFYHQLMRDAMVKGKILHLRPII